MSYMPFVRFIIFFFTTISFTCCIPKTILASEYAFTIGASGVETKISKVSTSSKGEYSIISGTFEGGSINIRNINLKNIDKQRKSLNIFMAKIDSLGNILWAKNFGGDSRLNNIAWFDADIIDQKIDSNGNIFLLINSEISKFTTPEIEYPVNDFSGNHLFKFTKDGDLEWVKLFTRDYHVENSKRYSNGYFRTKKLQTDEAGNVFIIGDLATCGTQEPTEPLILSPAGRLVNCSFLVKINSKGVAEWGTSWDGTENTSDFAIDYQGNIFVPGILSGRILTYPRLVPSNNKSDDPYLIKFNKDGELLWIKSYGDKVTIEESNIAVYHTDSNHLMLGPYTPSPLNGYSVIRNTLNISYEGKVLSKNLMPQVSFSESPPTALDSSGFLYMGFSGFSRIYLDYTDIGIRDTLAIKIDKMGKTKYFRNFGGFLAYTQVNDVAADNNGNMLIAGRFYNADLTDPPIKLQNDSDPYLIKISTSGTNVSEYQLNITKSRNTVITSEPDGINCGQANSMCKARFPINTKVKLIATTEERFFLKKWKGCQSVDSISCEVIIDKKIKRVKALIAKK